MKDFFAQQKQIISHYLNDFFNSKNGDLDRVHSMGGESGIRIRDFAEKGKMLRGGLVALAYFLASGGHPETGTPGDSTANGSPKEYPIPPRAVSAVGGVMELFQSAFLIHDDIMDRDEKRRGSQSVYSQYVSIAENHKFRDAYHTGEALGICVGDISFFLAYEILAEVAEATQNPRLTALCSRELSYVGVAQMLDVYWGQEETSVSEKEVFDLYRYKTGRYTFSLPLMCGGLLGKAEEKQIEDLEKIGELLGIVFQLKDDELGLFGDENQLGKPIGSDISEGKKTLFYVALMERAGPEERKKLEQLFGKYDISEDQVNYVREIVERHGIREWVMDICRRYADEAREVINGMENVSEKYRGILAELLEYSLKRTS